LQGAIYSIKGPKKAKGPNAYFGASKCYLGPNSEIQPQQGQPGNPVLSSEDPIADWLSASDCPNFVNKIARALRSFLTYLRAARAVPVAQPAQTFWGAKKLWRG